MEKLRQQIKKIFDTYQKDTLFESENVIKQGLINRRWWKLEESFFGHIVGEKENILPCPRKRFVEIEEGLITTADVDKTSDIVKRFLKNKCNLADYEFFINIYETDENDEKGFIEIGIFDMKVEEHLQNTLKKILDVCGYFLSNSYPRENKMMFQNKRFFCFVFQPKFPGSYKVPVLGDCLYHFTPLKNLNKILKIGIKPKQTLVKGIKIPERCYFFTEYNPSSVCNLLDKKKAFNVSREWVAFQLKVNKIPEFINFYKDLDMPNNDAVFSYETIPLSSIEAYQVFNIDTGEIIKQ